jgi:DNA-binding response OmpR family regulator
VSTILVVGANATGGRALLRALEAAGYVVRTAADGGEALEVVGAGRPRLIVLDMAGALAGWSPGDGSEAGGALLRRLCRDARVPVVVLGGPETPGEIVAAFDDGAADYLAEPYRAAEVVARVRAILRRV